MVLAVYVSYERVRRDLAEPKDRGSKTRPRIFVAGFEVCNKFKKMVIDLQIVQPALAVQTQEVNE